MDAALSPFETGFAERRRRAINAAENLTIQQLRYQDLGLVADALVDEYAAERLEVDFDELQVDGRPVNASRYDGTTAAGLEVTMRLPFRGPYDGLRGIPLIQTVGDQGHLQASLNVLPHEGEELGPDRVEEALRVATQGWCSHVVEAVRLQNERIDSARASLHSEITDIVTSRGGLLLALDAAASSLGIRLIKESSETVPLPVRRRALSLELVESLARDGVAEASLATQIADDLIDTIAAFGRALERSPSTANRLTSQNEESLRDVLLFILNANWHGLATGETFIGEGKSDILLRWHDRDAFIAECKFWRGPAYFDDAVSQLLDRYVIWRATRVALIVFIRGTDATATIRTARDSLHQHNRTVHSEPLPADSAAPTTYAMRAHSDTERIVRLTLVPVVLPGRPPR